MTLHHISSFCGPERDIWSASRKLLGTEENQVVLILDSFEDTQSWGEGEQRGREMERKTKMHWAGWGPVAWSVIVCCLNPVPPPSPSRQDVAWHLYPGFIRTMARGMEHFSPPPFQPPNLSSIYLSFFSVPSLTFPNQPVALFPWPSSSHFSSEPPLLPPHLSLPRLIVGWYWASRGKPTKQRRCCGGYLVPYPPPVSEAANIPLPLQPPLR